MTDKKPRIWTPLGDTLCTCTRRYRGKHNTRCIFNHSPERVETINEMVQKLRDRNAELRARALGSDSELVRVNIAKNLLWYLPQIPSLSHGVSDLVKHTQQQLIQNLVKAAGGEIRDRYNRYKLTWRMGGKSMWPHDYDLEPEAPRVAQVAENPWRNPEYFFATIPGETRAKALEEALMDFTRYLRLIHHLGYLEGMNLLMRLHQGELTLPAFEGDYEKAKVNFGRAMMELRLRFMPKEDLEPLEEEWHRKGLPFSKQRWMDQEARRLAGVPVEKEAE